MYLKTSSIDAFVTSCLKNFGEKNKTKLLMTHPVLYQIYEHILILRISNFIYKKLYRYFPKYKLTTISSHSRSAHQMLSFTLHFENLVLLRAGGLEFCPAFELDPKQNGEKCYSMLCNKIWIRK